MQDGSASSALSSSAAVAAALAEDSTMAEESTTAAGSTKSTQAEHGGRDWGAKASGGVSAAASGMGG